MGDLDLPNRMVRGWRLVTDAVHASGGRIIAQLWHTGAIAHPDVRGGSQPLSASDVDAKDVRCNPVHGLAEAGKSPVYDHQLSSAKRRLSLSALRSDHG
jgi:2,4-dienoyl-CoA reductase-like NADH-dependent reductase (Old Yellow Enzyme family)